MTSPQPSRPHPARTLVVLGTGGTISGRAQAAHDHVGYRAGEVGVSDLLRGVQDMAAQLPVLADWVLEAEQVAQVDSKDMGPAVWRELLSRVAAHLQRPEVAGVVVTHGTDTLEESAWLLQLVLAPSKPVVLTCAMRPASALVPDGPQNLLDALCTAAEPGARGVVAVCAGQVHAARYVQKVHNYRLDAFDSGDAGPLASVADARLRRWQDWPVAGDPLQATHRLQKLLAAPRWPRVEWLTSHAGADGAMVRALLAQAAGGGPALDGLVVAGTGNGTLHADLLAALVQARAAGVRVWRSTRCAYGSVLSGAGAGAMEEPEPTELPPAKARLSLMLALLEA